MAEKMYDPYPWSLRSIIENNFYEVPIYQRPYSWSELQVKTLLDDLISGYSSFIKGNNEVLFTGTIFLRRKGKGKDGVKDKYEIVDGQQRITTFSMILLCIYSIATKRKIKDTRKDMQDLKSFLWKYSNNENDNLKNEKLLTLNSVDKEIFEFIFDNAYDDIKGLFKALGKYTCKCNTEKNIVTMFNNINSRLLIVFNNDGDEIMKFLNYIADKTLFIAIESSVSMTKVFSVFESINSKGKPLDEIDKIKTYIFSELNETDYSAYLTKWGQLIVKSDDNLASFLQIYVKAFLCYYRQTINIINFRRLSKDLVSLYAVSTVSEALKKLIDNMLECVDSYKYLFDIDKAVKLINKKEFTFFYKLFGTINYKHPQSVFLRAFHEFENNLLNKDEITNIVKSCTLFLFKFQSINGGDSKDSIGSFERISKTFYDKEHLDSIAIVNHFRNELVRNGITKDIIKAKFNSIDIYTKHDLAYSILSILESIDESNKNKLLFSQATFILSSIKDTTFNLDHMLPQYPDQSNPDFKYARIIDDNGENILQLKPEHDFPQEALENMKYDVFISRILGKIGNIRLFLPELNNIKGNQTLHLPNHENFTTYNEISSRSSKLADLFFNCPDLN